MRVAILSESPADEAAVGILVGAVLEEDLEIADLRVRSGGIDAALRAVSPTLKSCHYQRTADALIVVVDSDNSPVHRDHEDAEEEANCRYCRLQSEIASVRASLRELPGLSAIATAVAVPTPSIEAWYLLGTDSACTEAGWLLKQRDGKRSRPEIRRLKREAYGTERPSLEAERTQAVEHAERLLGDLAALEASFPNSFGLLAAEIRSWSHA